MSADNPAVPATVTTNDGFTVTSNADTVEGLTTAFAPPAEAPDGAVVKPAADESTATRVDDEGRARGDDGKFKAKTAKAEVPPAQGAGKGASAPEVKKAEGT